ncbi:hypothetical protein PR048_003786 [Dryococelus australis]|uniref:Uncharacterized protein n=1 Tax=Dryococelus australis TaxID=614101 RepID=A0ABQ9IP04_9NEOP|nr:hypothetical protein PR048_003786 [Dryococelus australis]
MSDCKSVSPTSYVKSEMSKLDPIDYADSCLPYQCSVGSLMSSSSSCHLGVSKAVNSSLICIRSLLHELLGKKTSIVLLNDNQGGQFHNRAKQTDGWLSTVSRRKLLKSQCALPPLLTPECQKTDQIRAWHGMVRDPIGNLCRRPPPPPQNFNHFPTPCRTAILWWIRKSLQCVDCKCVGLHPYTPSTSPAAEREGTSLALLGPNVRGHSTSAEVVQGETMSKVYREFINSGKTSTARDNYSGIRLINDGVRAAGGNENVKGACAIETRASHVHAHTIHGAPINTLEAGHVDIGETVSLIRGGSNRGWESSSRRRCCCLSWCGCHTWPYARIANGRRDGIWGITIAGECRVRPEQFSITGESSCILGLRCCGVGGLHMCLGLCGGQLRSRCQLRGGSHAHSQRPQHHALAQQGTRLHRLLRLCFLTLHSFVLDGVEVDLAHAIHHILVLECDKAEASVALGLLVHQHHRSFMMRTSVTGPNIPKYSLSFSEVVCQLRPPTNNFPGAGSPPVGVDRPEELPFCVLPFIGIRPLCNSCSINPFPSICNLQGKRKITSPTCFPIGVSCSGRACRQAGRAQLGQPLPPGDTPACKRGGTTPPATPRARRGWRALSQSIEREAASCVAPAATSTAPGRRPIHASSRRPRTPGGGGLRYCPVTAVVTLFQYTAVSGHCRRAPRQRRLLQSCLPACCAIDSVIARDGWLALQPPQLRTYRLFALQPHAAFNSTVSLHHYLYRELSKPWLGSHNGQV